MDRSPGDITLLLADIQAGDKGAEARLAPLIYAQLHRIADGYMRLERRDHTLQATALLNEAYIQLVAREKNWQDRSHFFAVASRVMRSILVDYARSRCRAKRSGAHENIDPACLPLVNANQTERWLALEEALSRLEEWDPRLSQVVELRFFGGLTEGEAAEALGVSLRTVKRDWSLAKAWLYSQLGQ